VGLPRVHDLCASAARVRFLSVEPLLEELGRIDLKGLSWVIVGGESGAGARTLKRDWVLAIERQCRDAGVPFFFKQWGGVRKKESGRKLSGRTYDELPRVIRSAPPVRARRLELLERTRCQLAQYPSVALVGAAQGPGRSVGICESREAVHEATGGLSRA
jgi:hypothetical protein